MLLLHDSKQEMPQQMTYRHFHIFFFWKHRRIIWEFVPSSYADRYRSNSSIKWHKVTMFAFQSAQHPQKTPLVQALHIYLQNQQRTTRWLLFTCATATAKMKNNPKPDKKKSSQESGRFSFSPFNNKKEAFAFDFFLFLFKSSELLWPFFFFKVVRQNKKI